MRMIDDSPFVVNGEIDIANRLRGTMEHGFSWYPEMQSQKLITERLGKVLTNSFTLLRNFTIPETEISIPLILIGPAGIRVMIASSVKGIFRAKGEDWMEMKGGREYKPARRNLMRQAMLMTRALERYFEGRGVTVSGIETVLLFSDPGVHVDTMRPVTRIVLHDAMERFGASLSQNPVTLNSEDAQVLVDLMTDPVVDDPYAEDVAEEYTPGDSESVDQVSDAVGKLTSNINFTRQQWMILGFLAAGQVCVIMIFLIYVIFFD